MGQKSSLCWRFGNLRNRHSLERMIAKGSGPIYGVATEAEILWKGYSLPPIIIIIHKGPASLQVGSHRLSISPCNLYQCTSSRPPKRPLI